MREELAQRLPMVSCPNRRPTMTFFRFQFGLILAIAGAVAFRTGARAAALNLSLLVLGAAIIGPQTC